MKPFSVSLYSLPLCVLPDSIHRRLISKISYCITPETNYSTGVHEAQHSSSEQELLEELRPVRAPADSQRPRHQHLPSVHQRDGGRALSHDQYGFRVDALTFNVMSISLTNPLSPFSPWDVGARESSGNLQHEAHRFPQALEQRVRGRRGPRRVGAVQRHRHPPEARRVPHQHGAAWHGAAAAGSGHKTAVLPHRSHIGEQHSAPQGPVLLPQGHADQVQTCVLSLYAYTLLFYSARMH